MNSLSHRWFQVLLINTILFSIIICLHTVKWLQHSLSNMNDFNCMQLNSFKYSYVTPTIQFNTHMHTHTVCTLFKLMLNEQTILFDP